MTCTAAVRKRASAACVPKTGAEQSLRPDNGEGTQGGGTGRGNRRDVFPNSKVGHEYVPSLPQFPGGGFCEVLLWRLCGWVFTRRRHNPLDSQVGHHVPVVLIGVRRIEREHGELR